MNCTKDWIERCENLLSSLSSHENYGLYDEELDKIYNFLALRTDLNDAYLLKATDVEQCEYYLEKLRGL